MFDRGSGKFISNLPILTYVLESVEVGFRALLLATFPIDDQTRNPTSGFRRFRVLRALSPSLRSKARRLG
jgi:hypothetical protein